MPLDFSYKGYIDPPNLAYFLIKKSQQIGWHMCCGW
jgi:hypothetical protein